MRAFRVLGAGSNSQRGPEKVPKVRSALRGTARCTASSRYLPPVPRVVFMSEDQENDLADGAWLTGRFSGALQDEALYEPFQGLSLEDALAWARARTDMIALRYGERPNVHYSAGAEPLPDMPSWPPPDLAALVRRRHPDDRWRDRTDADAPIAWLATAEVVPAGAEGASMAALEGRRPEWRAVIAKVAQSAAAEWDSEPLDEFISDVSAAREEAGDAEEFGWFTFGTVALRIWLRVEASTASAARSAANDRLELPPGWRIDWTLSPDR
jgi:hypothetical protein